jgi:HEAT repeat protein
MVKNLSSKLLSLIEGRSRRSVTQFCAHRGLAGSTPILSRAVRCFAVAAVALLTVLSDAQAQGVKIWDAAVANEEQKLAHQLQGCATLPGCLAILDAFSFPGTYFNEARGAGTEIAGSFLRFGEPAKHELLRRAAGDHVDQRTLASAILSVWGAWSWSPSDVPAIRAALKLSPGGWMARPLAEIKTPEAIEVLLENLQADAGYETVKALAKIRPPVLPRLLPLLADDQRAPGAAIVVQQMGKEAFVVAPDWLSLATSADALKTERIAALRGLAAMGWTARWHEKDLRALLASADKDLRTLLASQDSDIRTEATNTLVAFRDASVVTEMAERCNPSGSAFDRLGVFEGPGGCLRDIASLGDNARKAGSILRKFLTSPNGEEVAGAVSVLGYIGYDAAIPEIEQQLRSPDWRVVYSAARSLGWLGATGSIPELERVASAHWLPEVRRQASTVVDALKGSERGVARPEWLRFVSGDMIMGRDIIQDAPACASGRWEWRDAQFSGPPPRSYKRDRTFGAGVLIGIDTTGYGRGKLSWQPADGSAQLIHENDVVGIEPAEGGAIVLFGGAHRGVVSGYAVRVSRRGDGSWSLSEVARMPSFAEGLATIGPNLFAAWGDNRVVILSDKEILGLARCVDK